MGRGHCPLHFFNGFYKTAIKLCVSWQICYECLSYFVVMDPSLNGLGCVADPQLVPVLATCSGKSDWESKGKPCCADCLNRRGMRGRTPGKASALMLDKKTMQALRLNPRQLFCPMVRDTHVLSFFRSAGRPTVSDGQRAVLSGGGRGACAENRLYCNSYEGS